MENRKKILIADDEPDFVSMLKLTLESVGFEVITAAEGVRTIQIAHAQKPDLILLDINMPAGTGDTVLKALRSKDETKNIPVIVVTASGEADLANRVLSLGAEGFIVKPFDMPVLFTKIQDLLQQI